MATSHFYDLDFPHEMYDKDSLSFIPQIQDFIEFASIFCQEVCGSNQEGNRRKSNNSTKSDVPADLLLNYLALSQASKQPQVIVVNNTAVDTKSKSAKETMECQEKKEDQAWLAVLLGSIGLGLFSLWKVADTTGQVEYLNSLFELLELIKFKVECLEHWIQDRKLLKMVIPETINKDFIQLKSICINLVKLNNTQEKIMSRNSYAFLTVGAGMIFASRFQSNPTRIFNIGILGIGAGVFSWIYSNATYSSKFHQRSLEMIAKRMLSDIEEIRKRSEKRETDLLRLQAPKIPKMHSNTNSVF